MSDTKFDKLYRECEEYFNRNYTDAPDNERSMYLKGVIDALSRVLRN